MPAPTREAALQQAIDGLVDDLGATAFEVLFTPVPTQNFPFLVSFEAPAAGGLTALYVAQIDSGGVALPGGGAEFTATVETGPVLLSDTAIAGSLVQIEAGGELLTEELSYLTDEGYEVRYPLQFETVGGIKQVSLMVNGDGYLPGFTSPNIFDERDVALAQYEATDPTGSNQGDVVDLADGVNFSGFKGADTILFDHGATIYGGSGEDIIQSYGDGDDVIFGNQNDDRIYSGRGTDSVDGGTGDDFIVMMGSGEGFGGKGNDEIRVGRGHEWTSDDTGGFSLYGGQGQDLIVGSVYVDTLVGGDGADDIYAGYGSVGGPGDFLYGGKGNDALSGSGGGDIMFGGNGKDFMRGWQGDDEMRGGGSNDEMFGNNGEDLIYGGDGNDTLQGGKDADTLYGGNGNDILSTEDEAGGRSNVAGDAAYGGSGNDVLYGGRTADALYGGKGRDFLFGDKGDDTLDGGSADDTLEGGNGADVLNGGDGEDLVEGGRGDDYLRGGHDDDVLTGGQGADIFGFGEDGSSDVVTDFEVGEDRIELVNFSGNLTFEDLFLSQDDSAAVIAAGDVTIRLENTDVEDLDEGSFLF